MAPMVEAARDGRLDAREQASVARHVATCATCRASTAGLDRLAQLATRPILPSSTPLEHQRARVALLNDAARHASSPVAGGPRPRRRVAALALALAAGIAGIGWRVVHDGVVPGPALARTLPAPPRLAEPRRETRIVGIDGARFTRSQADGLDRVELEDGVIDLRVRPLAAGERFLVATSDSEVEVRGTAFRVEARARRLRSVSVFEGHVEVRYAGTSMLLGPGETFTRPEAPTPAVATQELVATQARVPATAHTPSTSGAPVRKEGGSGKDGLGSATPPRDPKGAARAEAGGASAFAEGMRLVERGDYAAGAEKLDAYRRQHPADARAEDAAYMSILALQRAGRNEDAAAAAKRYLHDFPNGFRRAEVQGIAR